MATEKRERQRAARQARFEAETTEQKQTRRKRTGIRVAAIVGAALLAAFAYSMIFGGNGDDDSDEEATPEEDEEVEDAEPELAGEAFEGREADGDCPPTDGSAEPQDEFDGPPPWCIDVSASYVAEVETTEGTFEITLDPMQAPVAVNNFVFLARSSYYDGAPFHRVITDFVVQGGDPVGEPPGTGDPGYSLGDDPEFTWELPFDEPYYPLMSVAMANREGDPGTAGSQFFVVTGEQGESLSPEFTRFGQVTEGEDVIRAIESEPIDTDDADELAAADLALIENVTITETDGTE